MDEIDAMFNQGKFVVRPPKWAQEQAEQTAALALPFPIRKNFLAQIVVPRNMTAEEGERLCAFVKSLVAPK